MIKLNRRLALLGGLSAAGCASAPPSSEEVAEFSLALQARERLRQATAAGGVGTWDFWLYKKICG